MTSIGILGYGEIGKALSKFYGSTSSPQAKIKDLNRDDGLAGVDVLHICIPWSEKFIDIAVAEMKAAKPKLTIIHSTVAPGTTKRIIQKLPGTLRQVVHSPVRGVHPYLYEGIQTFVKYIGAEDKKSGAAAQRHLKALGIRTKIFVPAVTTELGKLLDTTYYGLAIAWHGEMKKMCDTIGVDFEEAATDFNKTYNEGYAKLGMAHVARPVLYPPKDGIGGHCIAENSILLREQFPGVSSITDFILSMGKDEKSMAEGKPYLNKTWLYAEYWGKGRSSEDIGKQFGVSGENICAVMDRRGIPMRNRRWTQKQIQQVLRLSEEGKTFKEISDAIEGKTYDAVRNLAYKGLHLRSSYDPAVRDETTRRKISASLQGVSEEEWDGFIESVNSLIRKSVEYQKWRKEVWERDNYTCQKCGTRNGRGKRVYLVAHHIQSFNKHPQFRMALENGITLCKKHHLEFHNRYGRGNNTKKQLNEYLL